MYNPEDPSNEAPTVVVGGNGGPPKPGLLSRAAAYLRRFWLAATPRQKLLIAGSLVVIVAAGVVLVVVLFYHSTPKPTARVSGPSTSRPAPGSTKQPASSGNTTTPAPSTTPDATAPAQNGPAKSKTGSGSSGGGSTGGGSSSGGGSGEGGGSTGCALPKYPDASCTGVPGNITLAVLNGNMQINTPNTIIEGKDIRGCVEVHAPGVVIRNSKISCDNFGVVLSHNDYSGTGLLLEDVDISCNDTLGTGIGDYNITVRRANIHSCQNGFDVDGAFVIEDSYIHDLIPYDTGTDPHVDGVQITPVGNNVTIRHNSIDGNNDGSSAITTPRVSDGVISNILIQDNLLFGGGYTLYCQVGGAGNNFRVINNHFSTHYYPTVGAFAPWIDCQDETQVTGNVYHESGQPVAF